MTTTDDDYPVLPELEDELLEGYESAHAELHRRLSVAPPIQASLFKSFTLDALHAAIGGVRPSVVGLDRPPLFPPPRAFLGSIERRRLEGARAAVRHVRTAIQYVDLGVRQHALGFETPYVLHALTEGRLDNARDTAPGLARRTPVFGDRGTRIEVGADVDHCVPLVRGAIERVHDSSAPALVRAAWLCFVVATVHPFADGNGRTSRLLYLTVAASDLDERMDWGIFEILRFRFTAVSAAFAEGDARGRYAPDTADVTPFARASAAWSIEGADLMMRRLRLLEQMLRLAGEAGLDDLAAGVVVGTWLRRVARREDLIRGLPIETRDGAGVVTAAHERRAIRRVQTPVSRRGDGYGPWFRVNRDLDSAFRGAVLDHVTSG